MPLHLLHAWAMAAADEQELFRPGRHFRAGVATWAQQQFRKHAGNLPLTPPAGILPPGPVTEPRTPDRLDNPTGGQPPHHHDLHGPRPAATRGRHPRPSS